MTPTEQLCYLQGVGHNYIDFYGQNKITPLPVREAILKACGHQLDPLSIEAANGKIDGQPWKKIVSNFQTTKSSKPSIQLRFPQTFIGLNFCWTITDSKSNEHASGESNIDELPESGNYVYQNNYYSQRTLELPKLAPDYYSFTLTIAEQHFTGTLAVCPAHCYQQPEDKKIWGISVQLYSYTAGNDFGIGDFHDLNDIIDYSSKAGADYILLNPLHKLFCNNPDDASPYSPSDRHQLNPLYISPLMSSDFSDQTIGLNDNSDFINYKKVTERKYIVFSKMFEKFLNNELPSNSLRYQAFLKFTLDNEHWRLSHFEYYLQWVAIQQLEQSQQRCKSLGMQIGLILDLAVGCAANGEEYQRNQSLFAKGVSIGAPADNHAEKGQNWGLPPLEPLRLKDNNYQFFIQLLRANMKIAGALRIDHIMGMFRLWWCIENQDSEQGSYVYYGYQELFAILALESHKNRCMLIGEDLGIVPEEIKVAMADYKIIGNDIFYFEREQNGEFKNIEELRENALLMIANHDVAPFIGWWKCQDLNIQHSLDLIASQHNYQQAIEERIHAKYHLLKWLELEQEPADLNQLYHALVIKLAGSSARILCLQLDDLAGYETSINIPGTHLEYPNWRRKITLPLIDIFNQPFLFEKINHGRNNG